MVMANRQYYRSIVPIMSPAWSPDGSHLAYVTFEQDHAVVYVQSLLTNQRKVVANFRGSNSAPAWSPDGRQLAIVLTRDGGSTFIWCDRMALNCIKSRPVE